jgi:hypothetical protein
MKFDMKHLQVKAADFIKEAALFYENRVRRPASSLRGKIQSELIDNPHTKERNRRLILLFAAIFLLDYLMYCIHTEKNIVDIFPVIPTLVQEKQVTVYLPSLNGSSIIREIRSIPVFDSDEQTAKRLFEVVLKGSIYENTAVAVPASLFVRKVWMYGHGGKHTVCVFDLEPVELKANLPLMKNSERNFIRALNKTIAENIPSIKQVLILEKGVPGAALWEL